MTNPQQFPMPQGGQYPMPYGMPAQNMGMPAQNMAMPPMVEQALSGLMQNFMGNGLSTLLQSQQQRQAAQVKIEEENLRLRQLEDKRREESHKADMELKAIQKAYYQKLMDDPTKGVKEITPLHPRQAGT